jgi:adenosylhomocysteine nucleosidase
MGRYWSQEARGRRARIALAVALLAGAGLVWAILGSRAGVARGAGYDVPTVGIIDAFGPEQAPILAEMHVTGHRVIDGMTFWEGTIGGYPVVDVCSGEIDESAELASYILDTAFHPRATLFSGTAGAQNSAVHVGDVVTSGFVADKSAIHYYLGGYQGPYSGVEVKTTKQSDLRGAIVEGYENPDPTPADASTYGNGPSSLDKSTVDVSAFAAPKELVSLAQGASGLLGTTTLADATGNSNAKGTITNKVFAGVVGQADVWTEPLPWIEAQNMLYQTDAEENEGSGFAFANAQLGVPWMLVRGISDSVWYPNAYDGVLASDHAAIVVKYLVEHLPATIDKAPETLADLAPLANAQRAGYLVGDADYFKVGAVSKVVYSVRGKHVTLRGSALKKLASEYSYGAGGLG